MQGYKEICNGFEMVWFDILSNETKEFFAWAKSIGCVWINGKDIIPDRDAKKEKDFGFHHFSIDCNGKLARVAMFAWVAKQFADVPKYMFCEYKRGRFVSPNEYYQRKRKCFF